MSAKHTPGPRIALKLSAHSAACLMCDTEDARFHMWLDDISLLPRDGVVFKNPAVEDHRVRTIRLDMHRGIGKRIADLMLPQVHALYPAAKEVLEQELSSERAAESRRRLVLAAERVAPELLQALRDVIAADEALLKALAGPEKDISQELAAHATALNSARAAIAKAQGGVS